MVTAGYQKAELVHSRTLDLIAHDGVLVAHLFFGDGQARGLAARLAFQFVASCVRQSHGTLMSDPEVMRITQGLIQIPAVFAKRGESSREDLIVAQAVRQNVKAAMTLPMNAMEWAGMVLRSWGLSTSVSTEQTHCL